MVSSNERVKPPISPPPKRRRGEESGRRSCLLELLESDRPWERRCRGNGPGARQLQMSSLERRAGSGGWGSAGARPALSRGAAAGRTWPALHSPTAPAGRRGRERSARGSPGAGRGPADTRTEGCRPWRPRPPPHAAPALPGAPKLRLGARGAAARLEVRAGLGDGEGGAWGGTVGRTRGGTTDRGGDALGNRDRGEDAPGGREETSRSWEVALCRPQTGFPVCGRGDRGASARPAGREQSRAPRWVPGGVSVYVPDCGQNLQPRESKKVKTMECSSSFPFSPKNGVWSLGGVS